MRKIAYMLALSLPWTTVLAQQESYRIDEAHSFANWTIRHVAAKTAGTFNDIQGKLLIDRDNLHAGQSAATVRLQFRIQSRSNA